MKVWVKTEIAPEGKYLVVRRDGTIPSWPHFVLGGNDPNTPAALRSYADEAERNGLERDYVESIRELADDFEKRAKAIAAGEELGKADPDAPPHRKDNPAIVALMRGQGDLSTYGGAVASEACPNCSRQMYYLSDNVMHCKRCGTAVQTILGNVFVPDLEGK